MLQEDLIFNKKIYDIPGINLNTNEQIELFEIFTKYYAEIPFKKEKTNGLRYYFENPQYSYSDAIILYCMIRHLKSKRIIEVGSGYSSSVMMDTNEIYFNSSIDITFIEPYPDLLLSLMKNNDINFYKICNKKLQGIDINIFKKLNENDILFIDSTHVSKINSDVNFIFFKVLPSLNRGVFIHFHDIFYPFEYSKQWIYDGRAWNENYILRAFLQYNNTFKIAFFNTYLVNFYEDLFRIKMPLCLKLGGSIWIKKCK